jgi:hypothetical protein
LLISEEDEGVLRGRADAFGLLDLGSEYISRSSGVFGVEWHNLIARATERALAKQHRLLIVDTFPGLAGLQGEQENDAGAIGERLRPLQVAAGEGLSVLFLHHMNGQGQPRGSKAFRGIVDTSIRLYRQGNDNSFRLDAESRFPAATPVRLKAKLVRAREPWRYEALDRIELHPTRDRVSVDALLLATLVAASPVGATYEQLDDVDGLSRDIAKRRLPDWRSDGKVDRHGEGTKTDPYHWFVPTGT